MTNCLLCQSSLRHTTSFDEMMSLAPAQARQLCEECAADFFRLDSVATCVKCGRRLKAEMSNPCYDCERWQQQISFDFQNRALYKYNSAMKDYMKLRGLPTALYFCKRGQESSDMAKTIIGSYSCQCRYNGYKRFQSSDWIT